MKTASLKIFLTKIIRMIPAVNAVLIQGEEKRVFVQMKVETLKKAIY